MICPQCGKNMNEQSVCAGCGYTISTPQKSNWEMKKPSLMRGIKRLFMVLFFPVFIPILIYKNPVLSESRKKKLLIAVFAVYLLLVAASAGLQELPQKASSPAALAEVEEGVKQEEVSNLKAWSKTWISAFLSYPERATFLEDTWQFSVCNGVYEVSGEILAVNLTGGSVEHTFVLHAVKDSATGNGRCIDLSIDGESYIKDDL